MEPTQPPQQLICPACRLVQPEVQRCRGCRSARPVPPNKLPKPRMDTESEKAVTVLVCWIVSLIPLLFAVVSLVERLNLSERLGGLLFFGGMSLSLLLLRAAFGFKRRSALAVKHVPQNSGRQKLQGRVRRARSREEVRAHTSGAPCVAASLTLGPKSGGTYLRFARAAEFLLEQEDGTCVAVRGEVWVQRPKGPRSSLRLAPELIQELGLDVALATLPAVVEEHLLREGDVVEVSGELGFEGSSRTAAAYRSGGLVRVMRGQPALVKVLDSASYPCLRANSSIISATALTHESGMAL